MSKLSWISDTDLNEAVSHLLDKAIAARETAESKFGKNVIDPFSALFETAGFKLNFEDWKKSETTRQAQKALQNHIGDFHQKILGCVNGWENLGVGNEVDLAEHERKILAEVKNKYNTLTGGKRADLYRTLEGLVMPKASKFIGYTAFYVTVIPKKPVRFDHLFTPSDKSKGAKCAENELIREIDGAGFYTLVTRSENALSDLFGVLPSVVSEVSNETLSVPKEYIEHFFSAAFG